MARRTKPAQLEYYQFQPEDKPSLVSLKTLVEPLHFLARNSRYKMIFSCWGNSMLVREAADEYLASLEKRLEPATVVGYRHRLTVFAEWCHLKQVDLEQVRRIEVDSFVDSLRSTLHSQTSTKQNISTQTLVGYVRVILAFLRWCLDDEEYSEFVKLATVNRIKLPRMEQTIIETFDKAQLDALFTVCSKECTGHLQARDRAILAVLVETGIRASELCQLTIANTHLLPIDEAYIQVHGKGNKWRQVGLPTKSRKALKNYLKDFRQGALRTEPVFVSRYYKPLLPGGLLHIISRLGQWAHIEGVRCSPHTFRHTFACHYLLAGGDVYVLSRLMGHTSVRITERYLKAIKAKEARQAGNRVKSVLE